MKLSPENLYIRDDTLYCEQNGHCIKFNEDSMVRLSPFLEDCVDALHIKLGGKQYAIPQKP